MKIYTTSEIQTACKVLEALSNGVAIVEGTDPEDEIISLATQASITALRIIKTGMDEIAAEHNRSNQPPQ